MSSNRTIALCAGLLALVAAPVAAPAQNAPPASEQGAPAAQEQTAPAGPGAGPLAACKPDVAQFCSGIQPGGGRMRSCIRQHFAELSPGCQQALLAARRQLQQQKQQQ
jgi:hypothetical protein